ncbi:MAG: 2-oxo acid dehydrogenase subunit E2 [Fidelibacterota bacterium]
MTKVSEIKFPRTRIATFDVGAISRKRHSVAALIEVDVTEARKNIRKARQEGAPISFTAWLMKTIATAIKAYPEVAAILKGKRKLLIFEDVNVSIVVEKEIKGKAVPIPLVIRETDKKSAADITGEIKAAKNKEMSDKDMVLHKKSKRLEKLYYFLPGFLRRLVWRFILNHPKLAYKQMGNVVLTSIGMMGNINGWFIQTSVHPISFGISTITKKPRVVKDEIVPREVLNMTVLMDHDVVDGGPMARFISYLSKIVEKGEV